MAKELTLHNVIDVIQGVENRLDGKIGSLERRVFDKLDTLATHEQLQALATHMDERFDEVKKELRSEIGLSQKVGEVGIGALNSRFGRMETFMTKVAKKLDMDFQAS